MKKTIFLIFLPVVAMVMATVSLSFAETVDRIVAKVNGDVILNSEVQDRVRIMLKGAPELKTDDPARLAQIAKDILRQIIKERLADQEVTRLKIVVLDSEVDKALEERKRENGLSDAQLEYMLGQDGLTLAKFRDRIKKEMERGRLIERVLQSKIVITESQLDEAMKHAGQGPVSSGEGKRHLAVIFLPLPENASSDAAGKIQAQAKKIRDQLAGGADFAKMAKEFSKGPAADAGGDIGAMSAEDLASPIEQATRGLGAGQITNVVTTPAGYYILKVMGTEKGSAILTSGSDMDRRDKLRRKLMQEEVNRKYEEWIQGLESKSEIEMLDPEGSNPVSPRPAS